MSDHKDIIFGEEWQTWKDPAVPEYFNPTSVVLDKHMSTEKKSSTALIEDDQNYSYEEFLGLVCRAANGLRTLKVELGSRILLFGTDSV
ncbi:MAG: hypothetical protein CMM75_00155, partial [Rhodospirillaceae bacterium]|nr:hypothetical protein [Rhodospirillaceae bacterium]